MASSHLICVRAHYCANIYLSQQPLSLSDSIRRSRRRRLALLPHRFLSICLALFCLTATRAKALKQRHHLSEVCCMPAGTTSSQRIHLAANTKRANRNSQIICFLQPPATPLALACKASTGNDHLITIVISQTSSVAKPSERHNRRAEKLAQVAIY